MRTLAWFSFLTVFTLLMAQTLGCSCGDDDDDDDNGAPADDDDDDLDDDSDDDADDDDDTGPECVDEDGDTYGENCVAGPDCNDGDGAVWTIVTGYVDADGDVYPGTGVDLCTDGALPPEYFADSTDCDDADPTVHPGAMEFPDDGIDQDCDEADVQASEDEGYFVDGDGGNDANPGTMDEPVETIQAGIDLAAGDEDRPNVYIAEGTYTEDADVPLESVVNLFGGYDPETWTRDAKATTVLEADAAGQALVLRGDSDVVVQGMSVVGGSTNSIAMDDYSHLTVADSRIETPGGDGYKRGIYCPAGSSLKIIRSEIEVGESNDNISAGINATGVVLTMSSVDIRVLGAAITAGGVSLSTGSAHISDLSITIDESGAMATGMQVLNADLDMSDFSIALGDSGASSLGFGGSAGRYLLSGGTIDVGDSDGTIYGVYAIGSSIAMDRIQVLTGESGTSTIGVYTSGGGVGNHFNMSNSLVTTGEAMADNYAVHATAAETVLGNNTIVVGEGINRTGVFHTAGGPEFQNPVFYNNHVEADGDAGVARLMWLVSASPYLVFNLDSNNFFGDADCLVYDGTNCVEDIDDVNACEFDDCGEASGNISEDPDFAGASDFHPQTGSPLIDAGVNPFAYLPSAFADWGWYDLDGSARPQGDAWDIGAYEVMP